MVDLRDFWWINRDLYRLPLADYIAVGETSPGVVAGRALTVTFPVGYLYRIVGVAITTAANQTLVRSDLKNVDGDVIGHLPTAGAAGADIAWVAVSGTSSGVQEMFGDIFMNGGETMDIIYNQAVGAEAIAARIDVVKYKLNR